MNEKENETATDIINEMYDCDGVVKEYAERLDHAYSRAYGKIAEALRIAVATSVIFEEMKKRGI